jgi:protein-disulfide isomerase
MASRTEQKAQARAARQAAEQAAASKARQKRRLQLLAGTVLCVVIVAVAIIAISSAGAQHTPSGLSHGKRSAAITARVDSLLAGIPEHGQTLGSPHARYALTLYGDLQCPVCAALATGQNLDGITGGLPQFITHQVKPGHAKIIYRSMCTATCNAFTPTLFDQQQTAAYAAGMQNKFWYYEELFYQQQGTEGTPYVTPRFLDQLARQTPGLNYRQWAKDRRDPTLLVQVQADQRAATHQLPLVNDGRGTPGLIITGPRGKHFIAESIVNYQQLKAALKTVS